MNAQASRLCHGGTLMSRSAALLLVAGILAGAGSARACSLCATPQLPTFRQEAELHAKVILYGTIANPRLGPDGTGTSELHVQAVIRDHAALAGKRVVVLERYVPISDPKSPPQFLLFCDVYQGRLDPYRGVPIKSRDVEQYLQGALALGNKDKGKLLQYYFGFLETGDKAVADDAFLELAGASDAEIGAIAARLDPVKLRGWLKDPQTPGSRLALYAFLLGACGKSDDVDLLKTLLADNSDRLQTAYHGVLTGLVQLQPKGGWELVLATLGDANKTFARRMAALRVLRFYHGWQPGQSKGNVLRGLELLLGHSDMADLAVEDLRRWQLWEMTRPVLRLYDQKGYTAPIMRRAIVRFALDCPHPEARDFVARARQRDPETVRDLEEARAVEKKAG